MTEDPSTDAHDGGSPRRNRWQQILQDGGNTALTLYFRERVYASFTGLALVIVFSAATDTGHLVEHATLGLLFGVLGIVVAGFVADIIGHLVVHGTFFDATDLRVSTRIAAGAFSTVLMPEALLIAAWLEWISIDTALFLATLVYGVTLIVIGALAVRKAGVRWWQKIAAIGMLVLAMLLVVALQVLAKSV